MGQQSESKQKAKRIRRTEEKIFQDNFSKLTAKVSDGVRVELQKTFDQLMEQYAKGKAESKGIREKEKKARQALDDVSLEFIKNYVAERDKKKK